MTPQSGEALSSIVARLARRENGCEKSHRRGDWHLHDEAVQRLVEQLLPFTRKVAAPVAGEGLDVAGELRDLRDAVEIMDTKITPYGERPDGTTSAYLVADSTWHRVLAIARGSTSENARKALDEHRRAANQPVAEERT